METGCQNIQLCSTILKLAFPAEVVGPLFLFPMVYAALQLMEAVVLIILFRCYQRFTRKSEQKKGETHTKITCPIRRFSNFMLAQLYNGKNKIRLDY